MTRLRPQLPKGAALAKAAQIARLAERLKSFRNVTILSGAGISTESGLSDYRSPGKHKPPRSSINHNEYVSRLSVRQRYWARSYVGFALLSTTKPSMCHHALSALHDCAGCTYQKHITQNVDGLLQAAHMPLSRIIELHGSIHWLVCRACGMREPRKRFQARLERANQTWTEQLGKCDYRPDGDADLDDALVHEFCVPTCEACAQEALMPTMVFHGGGVPHSDAEAATRAVTKCDALLVVGSTVTTYSAYQLAVMAKQPGKFLAGINFGPTRADGLFDVKVEALVGDAVARLADIVIAGGFRVPASSISVDVNAGNINTSRGSGMLQV